MYSNESFGQFLTKLLIVFLFEKILSSQIELLHEVWWFIHFDCRVELFSKAILIFPSVDSSFTQKCCSNIFLMMSSWTRNVWVLLLAVLPTVDSVARSNCCHVMRHNECDDIKQHSQGRLYKVQDLSASGSVMMKFYQTHLCTRYIVHNM